MEGNGLELEKVEKLCAAYFLKNSRELESKSLKILSLSPSPYISMLDTCVWEFGKPKAPPGLVVPCSSSSHTFCSTPLRKTQNVCAHVFRSLNCHFILFPES